MHHARTSANRAAAAVAPFAVLVTVAACGSSAGPSAVSPTTVSPTTVSPTTAAPTTVAPSTVSPSPATASPSRSIGPAAQSCRQQVRRPLLVVGLVDGGATACLTTGERLEVRLPADAAGRWAQVGVVGPALSRPVPGPAAGSTSVTEVTATGPGTGRVLAVQACAGDQGCRTWVLEVRVRG